MSVQGLEGWGSKDMHTDRDKSLHKGVWASHQWPPMGGQPQILPQNRVQGLAVLRKGCIYRRTALAFAHGSWKSRAPRSRGNPGGTWGLGLAFSYLCCRLVGVFSV